MFDNYIINDTHFRNYYEGGKAQGFILCLRINYYRGIPLSMIHDIRIKVDDEVFTTKDMRVVLDGHRYSFDDMENITDLNWPFGEDLRLEIQKEGGLCPGKRLVEVTLTCRNAYFGVFSSTSKRTMTFG